MPPVSPAPSDDAPAVAAVAVEFESADARPHEVFYYAVTLAALATGASAGGPDATVYLWAVQRRPPASPSPCAYDITFRALGGHPSDAAGLARWLMARVAQDETRTGIRLLPQTSFLTK